MLHDLAEGRNGTDLASSSGSGACLARKVGMLAPCTYSMTTARCALVRNTSFSATMLGCMWHLHAGTQVGQACKLDLLTMQRAPAVRSLQSGASTLAGTLLWSARASQHTAALLDSLAKNCCVRDEPRDVCVKTGTLVCHTFGA